MWLSFRQAPSLKSSVCQTMSPEGWHTPPSTAVGAHRCQRLQDNQQTSTLIAHFSPAIENLNADKIEGKNNHKLAQQATVCPQGHTKYHVLKGSRSSEDLAAPKAQRLQKWLCWCQIWSSRSFPATAERTARVAMLELATAVLSTASGHWPP